MIAIAGGIILAVLFFALAVVAVALLPWLLLVAAGVGLLALMRQSAAWTYAIGIPFMALVLWSFVDGHRKFRREGGFRGVWRSALGKDPAISGEGSSREVAPTAVRTEELRNLR